MTSPLLRKPRTTRPSIRRPKGRLNRFAFYLLAVLGVMLSSTLTVSAEGPSFSQRFQSGLKRIVPIGKKKLEPTPDEQFQPGSFEPTYSFREARREREIQNSLPAEPGFQPQVNPAESSTTSVTIPAFGNPTRRQIIRTESPDDYQPRRFTAPTKAQPISQQRRSNQGTMSIPPMREMRTNSLQDNLQADPFKQPIQRSAKPTPLLLFDPTPVAGLLDEEDEESSESEQPATEDAPPAPLISPAANRPSGLKPISEINPFWDYSQDEKAVAPEEIPLGSAPYQERAFSTGVYTWRAPNLSHKPLYFEDVQLERYGHTYNRWIQPFASTAKMGAQLVGLPYQMALHPPTEEVYTLGYYQPGDPATPKKFYQIPLSTRAGLVQGGVMTGLFFLIP